MGERRLRTALLHPRIAEFLHKIWKPDALVAVNSQPLPSSEELARYIEARGECGKPWVWHLLRLSKLKENKDSLSADEYLHQLKQAHDDLMQLGEFWQGREQEVFGGTYAPASVLEPLPGSPEDR